MQDEDYVSRPVRPLDFLVILVGFIHNIVRTFETLTGEIMEITIYHSNHKTQTSKAWESMTVDLEKLQEDTQ